MVSSLHAFKILGMSVSLQQVQRNNQYLFHVAWAYGFKLAYFKILGMSVSLQWLIFPS